MKMRTGMCLLASLAVGILLLDLLAPLQAGAVYGTRRRTARRTAIVVSSAENAETAADQQQAAAPEKEAAADNQESEAAKQQAAAAPPPQAPAPSPSGAQPIGTIVRKLPAGCVQTAVGSVAYQKCGADYYRAAFQGSQLVYVTTHP
jgi:hypothetical protein